MKKYKKFIAVMLAFVLCAGTFMSDMGTKEVKAEGITYEDSFDFVVETEDEVAPGNEVALDVSVTCNKPMDCMMSYFSVTCFEYVDHCGVSWGDEIILLGSDGEEDIIITAENESTIPFAAGQTRTFRVTGTIPEEWVDGSSYIEFVVSARTTEGQEAELDGVFAYGYSDPDMGDDGEDDGSIEDGDVDYTPDEEYGPIETWLYPADGDMVPGNQVEYEFEVYNNTEEDKNYTVKFYHAKLGEKTEIEVITSVYELGK